MTRRIALACLLALGTGTALAQSAPEPFTLVVLGSSNAEGDGPTIRDSTWVNRLREHLRSQAAPVRVLNYAHGGYTTFHLRPTGALPRDGFPRPDPRHNISQALELEADAILISLTSNDSAREIPVANQFAHYDEMLEAAGDTPVWITTTTPRSGGISPLGRELQATMRDSTLTRYGDRAIDIWTPVALANGDPNPALGKGDGVHFNNAGHRLFFEQVRASSLMAFIERETER